MLTAIQPFPTNPSFQPPPPISDVIMTQIDQELRSGEKTIGQIATQFSVSKARIEAIAKLKEVEAEFRRQVSCTCEAATAFPTPLFLSCDRSLHFQSEHTASLSTPLTDEKHDMTFFT